METIESHVGALEAQLKQWGAKLDELVAKAGEVEAVSRADRRKRLNDLKAKHQAAQARLDELKSAGIAKWETFKVGVESAWSELELAVKKLSS